MAHKTKNKVLLLINTGTPDSPEVKDVRRYLSEFLNDKRVIDLPWLIRKVLVNLIIVPFRAPRSATLYRKLWTDKGSPLKFNLENLVEKVQRLVADEYTVIGAFRYGNPSLKEILGNMKMDPPEQVIVLPLFPQYASSTTGSAGEFVMEEMKTREVIPEVRLAGQFYSHPAFIDAWTEQVSNYDPRRFDHILFSYHGLPMRHIQKIHPGSDCRQCNCPEKFPENRGFCYKATCYETTRLLAEKLKLNPGKYSTSFQSRLSKNWLTPFTDSTIKNLALSGNKKLLVVAPSFVADCLETLIEINEEYQEVFKNNGGEEFVLSECLNSSDKWAEAIVKIAEIH